MECAIALLSHGCEVNSEDEDGNTPLHIAVQQKNVPLIQALTVFGADLNRRFVFSHSLYFVRQLVFRIQFCILVGIKTGRRFDTSPLVLRRIRIRKKRCTCYTPSALLVVPRKITKYYKIVRPAVTRLAPTMVSRRPNQNATP